MKRMILPLYIAVASIAPAYSVNLNLSVPTINYKNPADAVTDFNLLTGQWDATASNQFCAFAEVAKQKNQAVIVSSSTPSGYSAVMEGVTYTIFSTNMNGIGWIMGAKDTAAPSWTPLTSSQTTVYPFPGHSNAVNNLGANIQFAFVKLPGYLSPGTNIFPTQKIADFNCYLDGVFIQSSSININTATINISALSCQVATAKSVPIPLGMFMTSDLPAVGRNFGNYSTAVQLSCDSGVTPWMTISDASNANNTSNIIKLSPDSTASGIGVQVFYDNQATAKSLGADSSSKNNLNQFQVNNKTTSNGQTVSIPLQFKYIRTEEAVTAGDANATATVTFSYQ
ncbi:fimbrial protein [Yersinia intermedia]|uniref:fimbrial protein n=1 Tax=Yersinia intermedia TaxID=631 RepID=UPI001F531E4D|nr:fimbrial protein [Yersinia intermedia]UNK24185.1 fimbrial protein [Yersinia intermedia]